MACQLKLNPIKTVTTNHKNSHICWPNVWIYYYQLKLALLTTNTEVKSQKLCFLLLTNVLYTGQLNIPATNAETD